MKRINLKRIYRKQVRTFLSGDTMIHQKEWPNLKAIINRITRKNFNVKVMFPKIHPHALGICIYCFRHMSDEQKRDFFSGKKAFLLGEREKYTIDYGSITLVDA
jgi:hypothetical protein